jgi:hypothetical protein
MELNLVFLVVGFVLGYSLREAISQFRRARVILELTGIVADQDNAAAFARPRNGFARLAQDAGGICCRLIKNT